MSDKVYRAKISIMPAANNVVCTLQSILNQIKTDGAYFKSCRIDKDDWFSFHVCSEQNAERAQLLPLEAADASITVPFTEMMTESELKARLNEFIRSLRRFRSPDNGVAEIKAIEIQNNVVKVEFRNAQWTKIEADETSNGKCHTQHEEVPAVSIHETVEKQEHLLLLIDGSNLLSRSYYGTAYGQDESALMKTSTGVFTNAVKAFIEKLFVLVKTHKPSHVAVCWDVKRDETFRRQLYPEYKATRSATPEALVQQFDTVKGLLTEMGVACWIAPFFEADDLLGTLAKRWGKERKAQCLIYSNDRDLHQVIDTNISQILNKNGEEIVYTLQDFQDEHENISPEQFIDVKAVLGDKSDNIMGIPGVGKTAALPLIIQYGTIEGIYDHLEVLDPKFKRYQKKLEAGKASAILSKQLATIVIEVPDMFQVDYEAMKWKIDRQRFENGLERLELNSILKRVDSLVG